MQSAPTSIHREKIKTNLINTFLFIVFIFMLFMIMISDVNNLICILFVNLFSIILGNFKDRALIIPEISEFIELHTYKFGLMYLLDNYYICPLGKTVMSRHYLSTMFATLGQLAAEY